MLFAWSALDYDPPNPHLLSSWDYMSCHTRFSHVLIVIAEQNYDKRKICAVSKVIGLFTLILLTKISHVDNYKV
jgi:hypothetical protein